LSAKGLPVNLGRHVHAKKTTPRGLGLDRLVIEVERGCDRSFRPAEKISTPSKSSPAPIIGQDDPGRDEPALETIGRHSVPVPRTRVEVGRDRAARRAAGRDAALDVRA
jgi:hypothetical protein